MDMICSVALALRFDIVTCEPRGEPAPTTYLYLLCLCACPSVRRASPEDAPSQSQQNARISVINKL